MTDALVEAFLAAFDDRYFPEGLLLRYELMECLSQNDMGETLLVKDRQSGETCVAKCYAGQAYRSRTSESELLKRLRHAGLPAYVGEYQNETMLCVVRTHAPGESLDKWAQEKPFSRQQAVGIAVQLCDILEYLHRQSPPIIHRDIKPQNIILDDQGKVTLIDFGTSRVYDKASQEDTQCLGTRHYAAPEQYGFSQTDRRSDIYALGVLLCWMLTGSVEVGQASRIIADRWLAHVVARCAAFAPKDRYSSAGQVKDALTGRSTRRGFLAAAGAGLIVLAAAPALLRFAAPEAAAPPTAAPHTATPPQTATPVQTAAPQTATPAPVVFQAPLIEEAVRLVLHKTAGEALAEEDLLAVEGLYVFGNRAAADEAGFRALGDSFMKNDGTVLRGSVASLEDLEKLKNLRRLFLAYQQIEDLTPLSGLSALETVDLHHNSIADVTPLSSAQSLSGLFIFDTHVTDLTALRACPHLSTLDIGYTLVRSTSALDGLDSLRTLMARKTPLQSLENIETHPLLEQMYLSETGLLDLTPLLALPRLQVVEVDESMRGAAEAVAKSARFKVVYP